jgi:hypothetical protein
MSQWLAKVTKERKETIGKLTKWKLRKEWVFYKVLT